MATRPRSASAHQFRTSTMFIGRPPSGWGYPYCRSVAPAGEGVHPGVAAGGLVHLHSAPRSAGHAVVERPAPPADTPLRPPLAERRRAVERCAERPALAEGGVDLCHDVAAEEIPAAAPLVEDGRVIEERLDQEEFLPDEPAEAFHALEHAGEEAQSRPDLPRRQAVPHGAQLLLEIARRRAEEGVAPI